MGYLGTEIKNIEHYSSISIYKTEHYKNKPTAIAVGLFLSAQSL